MAVQECCVTSVILQGKLACSSTLLLHFLPYYRAYEANAAP